MNSRLRVLIVDDSALIRGLLTQILSSDPNIEVVGTAADPYIARDKLVTLKPDLMTLDIEMPRMDGISFLAKVMRHFPTRTVVISSLAGSGSATALRALELGAIDVIEKPSSEAGHSLNDIARDLLERIKVAGQARIQILPATTPTSERAVREDSFVGPRPAHRRDQSVLAIASSTGGTQALKAILPGLPEDLPATVIVQHMPALFTKTYAEHLQQLCRFEVKEAQDGDKLTSGRVLIAPGDFHMEISRRGSSYLVHLHQEAALHGVRPSADYLMKSVAKHAGADATGVILTGMGKDGAAGLAEMRKAGAFTIAQDERSCVVYGMPKAAVELGAIDIEVPLHNIAAHLIKRFRKSITDQSA